MTGLTHEFISFPSREDAAGFCVRFIQGALETALADKPTASLMVSGGSTPGGVFEGLSKTDMEWARVIVGLVDERWVGPENSASNEGLVRSKLLTGLSGAAGFLPMRTTTKSPAEAARDRARAYAPHCSPVDVIMLGMGEDGHAASWFPGSKDLSKALSSDETITALDASGCSVAGEHTQRMTLTGQVVASAKAALLLIFGDRKKEIYETSLTATVTDMPVKYAIDNLGPRLTVVWAP